MTFTRITRSLCVLQSRTSRHGTPPRWPILALAGLAAIVPAAPALGQASGSAFLNQQRAIEEEVRTELDRDTPTDQKFDIDWGAWYSFYLFIWDDGVKSSRTFRQLPAQQA